MSTAVAFKFYQPFPFCPAVFDIDSLDPTTIDATHFYIRNLTLQDAMSIYWNTETVDVAFNASFSTLFETISVTFNQTISPDTVRVPYTRVCPRNAFDENYIVFEGTGTEPNGFVDTPVSGPVDTADYSLLTRFLYIAPGASSAPGLTVQLNGLYTIWVRIVHDVGPLYPTGGGTLGLTGIDYASTTIPILSGYMPLTYHIDAGYTPTSTTAGTVGFSPNLYTY